MYRQCRRQLSEPLVAKGETQDAAQIAERHDEHAPTASASPLPSQAGTIKILAAVLVVVALLVTGAALLSKSGVVQPGGPPPVCRKSASLAVLRQEQAAPSSNAALLQLIVWGGKGKKAGLVFADSHLLNLQDHKWHSVQQKAGLLLNSLRRMPGLRSIWESSEDPQALNTDPSRLPAARWKQLSVTDLSSSSMIMFGGDGTDPDDIQARHSNAADTTDVNDSSGNSHDYFNDAWQVSLVRGKARWQKLWNTDPDGNHVKPACTPVAVLLICNFHYLHRFVHPLHNCRQSVFTILSVVTVP